MNLKSVIPNTDYTLSIELEDGRRGIFSVLPYLELDVFKELNDIQEFLKVINGKYYIEWPSGADLSADTILARLSLDSIQS